MSNGDIKMPIFDTFVRVFPLSFRLDIDKTALNFFLCKSCLLKFFCFKFTLMKAKLGLTSVANVKSSLFFFRHLF